ncbi:MAG: ATP-binding domain-containing protein, partial [Gammaproteobacteria bacterium]|nr:ATP-binding domain-containing protein [Gammaproteobacteria bacterium]
IGGRTLEQLRALARTESCSLWAACVKSINEQLINSRAANSVLAFLKLIDKMQEGCDELELHRKVEYVIEHSGLIPHHEKEGGEKARARIENLEELVSAANSFDESELDVDDDLASNGILAANLDQAALDAGDAQAGESEDAVQLMTLHSAKGLEFPLVFMAGMEEGLFPHKMSMENISGLEEERRLCYVGITRAMRKLYLCYAESRRIHGDVNLTRPSRFLREIPRELVDEIRMKSSISRPVFHQHRPASGSSLSKGAEVPQTDLSLGQRVIHGKFGEGVILNYEGQGGNARVQVNFDGFGSKWLVLSYAKLEIVA